MRYFAFRAALLPLACGFACLQSHAQTSTGVTFLGTMPRSLTTLPVASSAISSFGMDAVGNAYYADVSAGAILKQTPAGALQTLATRLSEPRLVTDGRGDLFVADTGHDQLLEIDAGSSAPRIRAHTYQPLDIAVDAAGTLFSLSAGELLAIEPNSHRVDLARVPNALRLATGPSRDGSTAVYVLQKATSATYALSILTYTGSAGSLSAPRLLPEVGKVSGFAVSNEGGLLLATEDASGKTAVVSLAADDTVSAIAPAGAATSGTPLAVDSARDLYYLASSGLQQVALHAADAGSVVLGQPFPPPSFTDLHFGIARGQAVSAISIRQDGGASPDFFVNDFFGNSSCTPGASTCTLTVAYQPSFGPGAEGATVLLQDASGHTLVSVPIHGLALTPDYAFYQSSAGTTPLATGFRNPSSIAQTFTTLFVADEAAGTITQLPASGDPGTVLLRGLKAPHAIALDTAGELFIAQLGAPGILELAADGTQRAWAPAVKYAAGLAVNQGGTLFIAAQSKILELTPDGTLSDFASPSTDGGYQFAYSVAVDGAGQVYAGFGSGGPTGAGGVVRFDAAGTPTQLDVDVVRPSSLALDPGGTLYVGDVISGTVHAIFKDGQHLTLLSGLPKPTSILFNGNGVTVADAVRGAIYASNRPSSTINFGAQQLDADLVHTIWLASTGTQPLLSQLSLQPGSSSAFVYGGPASAQIAPGTSLPIKVSFSPKSPGPATASLFILSNFMNDPDPEPNYFTYQGTGVK